MEVAVVLISILVLIGCGAYVYLMIWHPEWVGITGKSAHQTLAEHQEGSVVDDADIFSSERKTPHKTPKP